MPSAKSTSSPKHLLFLLLCIASMAALLLIGQKNTQAKLSHFWQQESLCHIPSMEQVR